MNGPEVVALIEDLHWFGIPVAGDGGEDHLGSASPVRAYVGWDLGPGHATPVAVLLRNLDGTAVSAAQWRRVKSSEIIAASRNLVEGAGLLASLSADDPEARETGRAVAALVRADEAPRVGSSRYPAEHYERVAAAYERAVRASDTQPVQAVRVAMREDHPGLSETTVRGWIRTARKRGLITTRARTPRAENTKGSAR